MITPQCVCLHTPHKRSRIRRCSRRRRWGWCWNHLSYIKWSSYQLQWYLWHSSAEKEQLRPVLLFSVLHLRGIHQSTAPRETPSERIRLALDRWANKCQPTFFALHLHTRTASPGTTLISEMVHLSAGVCQHHQSAEYKSISSIRFD